MVNKEYSKLSIYIKRYIVSVLVEFAFVDVFDVELNYSNVFSALNHIH